MREGVFRSPERLYDGYVFDLDGTIYLGDELLPGARRLVLALRELDRRVVFLCNNPTRDPGMYTGKLTRLGLETSPAGVVSPVVTMTRWPPRRARLGGRLDAEGGKADDERPTVAGHRSGPRGRSARTARRLLARRTHPPPPGSVRRADNGVRGTAFAMIRGDAGPAGPHRQ